MKFRIFVLAIAVIAAFAGTVRSTEKAKRGVFANWIFVNPTTHVGTCQTLSIVTNEPVCNIGAPGPVCTITPGVQPTTTAYWDGNLTCTLPLRQP